MGADAAECGTLPPLGLAKRSGQDQGHLPVRTRRQVAAPTLLLKLERADFIKLPPPQRPPKNALRNHRIPDPVVSEPICAALRALQPLRINIVAPG